MVIQNKVYFYWLKWEFATLAKFESVGNWIKFYGGPEGS